MRRLWWKFCAFIQGVSYQDYLCKKRQLLQQELEAAPLNPNALTVLREYFGLKSLSRTRLVFVPLLACQLLLLLIIDLVGFSTSTAGVGFLIGDITLLVAGLTVRFLCPGKN